MSTTQTTCHLRRALQAALEAQRWYASAARAMEAADLYIIAHAFRSPMPHAAAWKVTASTNFLSTSLYIASISRRSLSPVMRE